MNVLDIIYGRAEHGNAADVAYFYDHIRRIQHYVLSRHRRRVRRYILAMDIEDGVIDLGGES